MVVALQHLLEPDAFAARPHPDPRWGPEHSGEVGGEQPRAGQDIPSAAGRIEPEGEHGRRRQVTARVRGRDQMQAQRPPARHGVIAQQLQGLRRRTRDEAHPRPTRLNHRPRRDLRHKHHVHHSAPAYPQRPHPFGTRGEIEVSHGIALTKREERAAAGSCQFLPLPARVRQSCEAWELHAGGPVAGDPVGHPNHGREDRAKKISEVHGWRVVTSGSPGAARLRAGSNSRFRSPGVGLK